MTETPLLNMQTLNALRAIGRPGAPSLLERVVRLFEQESKEMLPRLREALERNDPEELRQAAHRFKSVCGNVGAETLTDRCSELEARGRDGQLGDAPGRLKQIEEQVQRVTEALAAVLAEG